MKITLTPEQEGEIVERWLLEIGMMKPLKGEEEFWKELKAAADKVLSLNWAHKYD